MAKKLRPVKYRRNRPQGLDLADVLEWFGVPTEPTQECVRPCRNVFQRSDGYYQVGFHGGRTLHSLVVEHKLGYRPPVGMACRHLCGHTWCINPDHLCLGTYTENSDDQARHGTRLTGDRHPQAKLTAERVQEIRALFGSTSDRAIARKYGVHPQTIGSIRHGRAWTLTDEQAKVGS